MNAGLIEWGGSITKSVGAKGIAYGGTLSGTLGRGALLLSALVHGGLAAAFIGWGQPQATPPQPIPVAIVAVAPAAAPNDAGESAAASVPRPIAQAPHQPAAPQPSAVEGSAEPLLETALDDAAQTLAEPDPVLEAALPEPVVEPSAEPVVEPLPAPSMKPAEPAPEPQAEQIAATEPVSEPVIQPAAPSLTETIPVETQTESAVNYATPDTAPAIAATAGQTAALPDPASALGTASESLQTGSTGFEPARYDVAALANPEPDYPWASRRAGEEGRVVLQVEVGADGAVDAIEVADSSGHRRLDEAALEAVRRWRFEPARIGDQAIATTVNVPVTFRLE